MMHFLSYPTSPQTHHAFLWVTSMVHIIFLTQLFTFPVHAAIHFNFEFEVFQRTSYLKTIKECNKANYRAINTELELFFESVFNSYESGTSNKNCTIFTSKLIHLSETRIWLQLE